MLYQCNEDKVLLLILILQPKVLLTHHNCADLEDFRLALVLVACVHWPVSVAGVHG